MMERMLAKMDNFPEEIRTAQAWIEANNEKVEVLRGTLVSRMDAYKAKTEANLEELMAAMKASQERTEALMDVSLQTTEDCLEKTEASQGKVEIKMKACLEEMKVRRPYMWTRRLAERRRPAEETGPGRR
jgi:uncharacterized protein YPO0396